MNTPSNVNSRELASPAVALDFSSLDPLLIDIGLMIGLLTASGDQLSLNGQWFANPLKNTSDGFKNNSDRLPDILEKLLGELSGNALGIPIKDPALLGRWFPLRNPQTGEVTDLNIVNYSQGSEQIFGFGVRHSYTVKLSGAEVGPDEVVMSVWGLIPLIKVGPDGLGFVIGQAGYPITLGAAADCGDSPMIDFGGLSLGGFKFSANLDFAASSPFSLSMEILQLKLPSESKASNRSLSELAQITGQEYLEIAASLFMAALYRLSDQHEKGKYLLAVVGLSSTVEGTDLKVPTLDWLAMIQDLSEGGTLPKPVTTWFNELLSDSASINNWLACVSGLMGKPAPTITGDGSRSSPYTLPLYAIDSIGTLNLTVASTVDESGVRSLYPGLDFSSKAFKPVAAMDAALQIQAYLELAELQLNAGSITYTGPQSLNFNAGIKFGNEDPSKPLFEGTIDNNHYAFGSLQGGVSLGWGLKVIPSFALVDVTTPNGKYDSIDLTNPETLTNVLEDELYPAIDAAISQLLGLDQSDSVGRYVATLVGFKPPSSLPDGVSWPVKPPLSASELTHAITNPLLAVGRYYQSVLASDKLSNDQLPFTYIVQDMARLMQQHGTDVLPELTVSGSGTQASPWQVQLSNTALPVALQVWQNSSDDEVQLYFGVAVTPTITLANTEFVTYVKLTACRLSFAKKGDLAISAQWLPNVGAGIELPKPFATPPVCDSQFKVDKASINAGWSTEAGWGWNLTAEKPTIVINNSDTLLAESLSISDLQALKALVTEQAATFAPALLGIIGLAIYRNGSRMALAADGVFGLLPNLASEVPEGVTWPADMPLLTMANFNNPVGDIKTQLNNIFKSADNAKAALGLLAWSIDSSLDKAPAIQGAGTFDSPWAMPTPMPFDALCWYDNSHIGFGAQYAFSVTEGELSISNRAMLNAKTLALVTDATPENPNPSFNFTSTITRNGGPLLNNTTLKLSIGSAELGFVLVYEAGQLQLTPILTLHQVSFGDLNAATLNWQALASDSNGVYSLILNEAVNVLCEDLKGNTTFVDVYTLLSQMGLTLKIDADNSRYGIDSAGWLGLTADPLRYTSQGLLNVLADATARDSLFALIERIIGITLPTIPIAVLETLVALNFLQPKAQGYAINTPVILQLLQAPVKTLENQCKALLSDQEKVKALLTTLKSASEPVIFGPFCMTLSSTGCITITIKETIVFGKLFEMSGSITFDVAQQKLILDTHFYNGEINLALTPQLTLALPIANPTFSASFEVLVAWGNGTMPVPQPLPIYPFNKDQFINDLAELAPIYALSNFVTGNIENQLLDKYIAAQVILGGIGMAHQNAAGKWLMPALNGLITDPTGWLLSNSVLGNNGSFNLDTFGKVLANIPEVEASNGIGFKKITDGVQLYGLPYKIHLNFTATASQAMLGAGITQFSIAGGKANIENLDLAIALNASYQPSFTGDIVVSGDASLPIKIHVGYNKSFDLSIGQTADNGIELILMPFPGWVPLVKQLANEAAQTLLPTLTDKLLTELEKKAELKPFISKLRTVATDLDVAQLLSDITAAISDSNKDNVGENIANAALAWLIARFDASNVGKTADAITAIFDGVISGVTSKDGLIRYTPSNDKLPITILAGKSDYNQVDQLGIWVQLNIKGSGLVKLAIQPTGIGVSLADSSIQYNLGLDIQVPMGIDNGPALAFAHNSELQNLQLSFDPLGDNSPLKRELYPKFFGQDASGDIGKALLDWLGLVLTQVLPRYISIAVLQTSSVKKWLETPLFTDGPTPANLLIASQLLVKETVGDKSQYVLNTLENLLKITPEAFIANFLKVLLENQVNVLPIKNGGIFLGKKGDSYGIRAQFPDIALGNTTLQLGATDSGWIERAGGTVTDPGIGVYLPITDRPHFDKLAINLINVGMDLGGKGNSNLINLSRFSLKSIEPRVALTVDFAKSSPVSFGAGATAETIAISLAPNTQATGDGGNPVAANILGSGSDSKKENPPVNPAFSIRAGYINNLSVELLDQDGDPADKVWIPVQRSFGPVHANKIGVGWENKDRRLDMLFDGSIGLAGLLVGLQELSVGVPVTEPLNYKKYAFDLQGLDISYKGGAVSMSAGLLKQSDPLLYTGMASLKGAVFALNALGSYGEVEDSNGNKSPSLFIFGMLQVPLGGIPPFFVNGIAAGFSYNRDLTLPDITEVQDFPLVKVSNFTSNDPGQALEQLNEVVKPKIGQYWIAAGIKATSFELIDILALLFVKFGRTFEISVIGLATLSLPKGIGREYALAYAELAIKATFRPDEGIVSVEAQLTPNSFILDKNCRLTGGFAFYLWYSGEYQGQFVISLGGYHVAFQKPDFYPAVPRIGFSWSVSSLVSIKGDTYFALTPIAVMAGGNLDASFNAGPIKAWFRAGANFIIAWKPFYFEADIYVVVGASFTVTVLGVKATITAQIGAGLIIWGPPIGGRVEVDWTVISFSIPFGSSLNTSSSKPLDWSAFEQNFLPKPGDQAPSDASGVNGALNVISDASTELSSDTQTNVLKINYAEGMIPAAEGDSAIKLRTARFTITINSVIPFTQLTPLLGRDITGKTIGIRPMQSSRVESPGSVGLEFWNGSDYIPVHLEKTSLKIVPLNEGAPGSLWSSESFDSDAVPDSKNMLVDGALMGINIVADHQTSFDSIGPFDLLKAFKTELAEALSLPFDQTPDFPAGNVPVQKDQLKTIADTLMADGVITTRNQYLGALSESGFNAPLNPSLIIMAKYVRDILLAPPVLIAPGDYLPAAPTAVMATVAPLMMKSAPTVTAPQPPQLVASTNRFTVSPAADPSASADVIQADATTTSQYINAPKTLSKMAATTQNSAKAPIQQGTSHIWQLDADKADHQLQSQGGQALRVSCFDKHDHLLDHQSYSDDVNIKLPEGTKSLVVKGLKSTACDAGLIGWQANSQILRLNNYYYQSGDVLIHPQCASPVRDGANVVKQGYITAAQMLKENQVQTVNQQIKAGWVETLMPANIRTVAVLIKGAHSNIEFGYAYKLTPEASVSEAYIPSDEQLLVSGVTVLFYNIPLAGGDERFLTVLTEVATGTQLLGVAASGGSIAQLKQSWKDQQLSQHSFDLTGDTSEQSSTMVTVKSLQEQ